MTSSLLPSPRSDTSQRSGKLWVLGEVGWRPSCRNLFLRPSSLPAFSTEGAHRQPTERPEAPRCTRPGTSCPVPAAAQNRPGDAPLRGGRAWREGRRSRSGGPCGSDEAGGEAPRARPRDCPASERTPRGCADGDGADGTRFPARLRRPDLDAGSRPRRPATPALFPS